MKRGATAKAKYVTKMKKVRACELNFTKKGVP